jgi:hypothetical protein
MCLSLAVMSAAPIVANAAQVWDLYDGADGKSAGVACRSYNFGAHLYWWHPGGDWVDAAGKLWGSAPFGSVAVKKYQTGVVTIAVTKALANGNRALYLRRSGGSVSFESSETSTGPKLLVTRANGSVVTLSPSADATIAGLLSNPTRCASTSPLGASVALSTAQGAVIEFPPLPAGFTKAVLQLTIRKAYDAATINVFAMKKPHLPESPVTTGFAANYPHDRGICSDSRVLYCETWDDEPNKWRFRAGYPKKQPWIQSNGVELPPGWTRVAFAPTEGYIGAGLRLTIPDNGIYGTAVPTVDFAALGYGEQEHLFYRYYMKYSPEFRDATPKCDGGKHPGFAGNTSIAGNSGVRVDGTNGWSLRGGYVMNCDSHNPIYPRVVLSTYAYWGDMPGNYGQHWVWTGKGDTGVAPLNQWVCVEGELKVNTPGVHDGLLRTWVNGRLAFEKKDLYLRAKPPYKVPGKLGIAKFWGTIHHGGTQPFGKNVRWWYDQTVIARSRIGCIEQ